MRMASGRIGNTVSRTTTKRVGLLVVVVSILLAVAGFLYWLSVPDLVWTAIDVNYQLQQADANLLQINRDVNILIDTGHRQYAGRLLGFLKKNRINRLNVIIITHGHRDHFGGLIPILQSGIKVDSVYFNPPDPSLISNELWGVNFDEIDAIQREIRERGIPLVQMSDETQWLFRNGISLKVLYIFDGINTPVGRTDINDTSAIIMLTHHKLKFLFAGEVNATIGDYITQRTNIISLKADFLKVPHHGAEGLPKNEFFAAVDPEVMVIPATSDLWFSDRCKRIRMLPGPALKLVNCIHGDIVIKSFGKSYRIETRYTYDQLDNRKNKL